MSEPKKRPGALWLMFYGRQRRGFPWLLFWVGVGLLVGAVAFRLVGGPEVWLGVYPYVVGALIVCALVGAIVAIFLPRRRR